MLKDGKEGGMQGYGEGKKEEFFFFIARLRGVWQGPGVPNDASKGPRINPSPIDLLAV